MRGFWVGAGVASLLVTGLTAPPVAAAEPAADTTVQAVRAQCEPHDQRDLWPGRHADPRRVRFDQDRRCGQHCAQRLLRSARGAQGHELHPSHHTVRHLLRPAEQPRRRQRQHGRDRGTTLASRCQVLHPPRRPSPPESRSTTAAKSTTAPSPGPTGRTGSRTSIVLSSPSS